MLVPVIGIVQISADAAHADRYTYLPGIGLAMAVTWAVADWSAGWKHRRVVLGGLMMAVMGALMVCGHIQTSYWKDSETLWRRALDCDAGNSVARNGLGSALLAKGDVEGAIEQYRKALELKPDYAEARLNLGLAFFQKGDLEEAIAQFREVLASKPDSAGARLALANALYAKGEREEAIVQYRKALELKPDFAEARINLGNALCAKGDLEEAIAQYRKAVEIEPDFAELRSNLGMALLAKGDVKEAMAQFQKSLEIKPGQTLSKTTGMVAGHVARRFPPQRRQSQGAGRTGQPVERGRRSGDSAHPGGGLCGRRQLWAGRCRGPACPAAGAGAKERRAGCGVAKGQPTLPGKHAAAGCAAVKGVGVLSQS